MDICTLRSDNMCMGQDGDLVAWWTTDFNLYILGIKHPIIGVQHVDSNPYIYIICIPFNMHIG